MAKERSTRPYLIRAIYEWCTDSGLTPYLSVKVDAQTRVPAEFVKNGEIVLNISPDAAHPLTIGDDTVQFAARFSGVSTDTSRAASRCSISTTSRSRTSRRWAMSFGVGEKRAIVGGRLLACRDGGLGIDLVRQSALGLKPLSGRRRARSRGDAQL